MVSEELGKENNGLAKDAGMEHEKMMKNGEKIHYMSIDEILENVGQLGKFQIIVLLIFSILLVVPSFQALNMVFVADAPDWRCSGVNTNQCALSNQTFAHHQNNRCQMDRSSWEYTKDKTYSLVVKFDLACENDYLSYLANSALFFGQIFGTIGIGWLSDRFGRKRVLFPSYVGLVVFAFAGSFSPNIFVFVAFRVLVGVSHGGVLLTNMVLAVELVGAKWRALAGLIIWNTWNIGLLIMTGIAYLVPKWQTLSIILSIPLIVLALGGFYGPESVRWLRSKGRVEEAELILRKVAKVNGKDFPDGVHLQPLSHHETGKGGGYMDLFRTWKMLKRTIFLGFMWFTNDFIYYGISLAAGDFTGNLYLDFLFISLVDGPANLSAIYIIDRTGRKKGSILGYTVTCICLTAYVIMHFTGVKITWIRILLALVAKSFGLISWFAVQVWTSELYPTEIRSQAMALFYLLTVSGGAASPWVSKFVKKFWLPLPFVIMASTMVLSAFFAFFIKETMGKKLADALEEQEQIEEEDEEKGRELTHYAAEEKADTKL